MSDEKTINSQAGKNLEPLNENDLNLAGKFGHIEKKQKSEIELEKKIEHSEKKEIANEIISAEKDLAYQKILSKTKKVSNDDNDDSNLVKSDAEKISKEMDTESQIKNLVDLAMTKSVVYAVKVARHLDDNYILDKLHDSLLAEELHKSLLEKGLIKND